MSDQLKIEVNGEEVPWLAGTCQIRRPLNRPATASFDIFSVPDDYSGSPRLLLGTADDEYLLTTATDYLLLAPGSPEHPDVNPGRSVEIEIDGTVEFVGNVQGVSEVGTSRNAQKRFSIDCVDLSALLSVTPLGDDLSVSSGSRLDDTIDDILDALDLDGVIDNGSSSGTRVAAFEFSEGVYGNQVLDDVVKSVDRLWRLSPSGEILTTNSGATPISSFEAKADTLSDTRLVRSVDELYNAVRFDYDGGSVERSDSQSISDYGRRTRTISDMSIDNATTARIAADAFIDAHKNPTTLLHARVADPRWLADPPASGDVVCVDLPMAYGISEEDWFITSQHISHIEQGDGKTLWDVDIILSKYAYREDWYSFWRRVETSLGQVDNP